MKNYNIVKKLVKISQVIIVMIFIINVTNSSKLETIKLASNKNEKLEDVISNELTDIVMKMNLNYEYYENQHYINDLISHNHQNISNNFRLDFILFLNHTEVCLIKTSRKSSLRKKEIKIRTLNIINKSIIEIEKDYLMLNNNQPMKKIGILFFEIIIPKFLHILENLGEYNLEINILNNNILIYNKAFHMTSNLKLIKFIDFDHLLHPILDDLYDKDLETNVKHKQIYFKRNIYKFNSILSLIEYETSKDYIDNPCYLNGYYRADPKILGSGNYEKCYKLINQIIKKLKIDKNQKFGVLNNRNLTSIVLGSEFADIYTVLNKTNITLKELKDESQHFCDLRYQYLLYLFENDERLINSICFKLTYSVILIQKIITKDSIRLLLEKTIYKSQNINFMSHTNNRVFILSKNYRLILKGEITNQKLFVYTTIIILFVLSIAFQICFIKFSNNFIITYFCNENQITSEINHVINLNEIKNLKLNYSKDFSKFIESESVFTYKAYRTFFKNMIEINKSFYQDVIDILNLQKIEKLRNTIDITQIAILITIGFIIKDMFRHIYFMNDLFEEKKHSLFILISFPYFMITLYSIIKTDFSLLTKIKETKNYDDEYNGYTFKI